MDASESKICWLIDKFFWNCSKISNPTEIPLTNTNLPAFVRVIANIYVYIFALANAWRSDRSLVAISIFITYFSKEWTNVNKNSLWNSVIALMHVWQAWTWNVQLPLAWHSGHVTFQWAFQFSVGCDLDSGGWWLKEWWLVSHLVATGHHLRCHPKQVRHLIRASSFSSLLRQPQRVAVNP